MQIIIPMSGTGRRFIEAGYTTVKPLIEVDGKPVIEHVVGMFPGETRFLFICNEEHLRTTPMREILKRIAPHGKVLSIPPHKKGPVYAVAQINEHIDDQDETIVNYCDFAKYWDYQDFLDHTRRRGADGAISAYKGFHPHMLGTTNYAFIKDEKQWIQEIREKTPFTDNRMNEFASDGTYYFRSGALVKKYFARLLELGPDLNGEYYISLVYNHMLNDGLKISVYEIQHMLQWGEPRDMEEYNNWSACFRALASRADSSRNVLGADINLFPMAGRGQRFVNEGYTTPKPLIEVSGKPMIIQASESLPPASSRIFICLREHTQRYPIETNLRKQYPQARILSIDGVTEGQACTCELGLNEIGARDESLLIGTSDNGLIWNRKKYQQLIEDNSVDGIVWTFRHHPSSARHPQMYGWVKVKNGDEAVAVSVKQPISDKPYDDHAIVGTFYFRKARYFLEALQALRAKNVRVNNEFYVDSCVQEAINAGLRIKVFECDHYIGWGTPNDLRTFEYWQSCFHKMDNHPYSLTKDSLMAEEKIQEYDLRFRDFRQKYG